MKYLGLIFCVVIAAVFYTNCSGGFSTDLVGGTSTHINSNNNSAADAAFDAYTGNQIQTAQNYFSSLGFTPSLTLTRPTHQMPAGFGTAHARPRYNPYGKIQNAFLEGAIDAYNIGFQTFKFWNGPEVKDDPSFYFLSAADRAKLTDFSSALDLNIYKAILSIPFRTVVFESDDVVFYNMAAARFTQIEKDRIYRTTYDFAVRLRKDFRGSARNFIIQNHEGDWHITKNPGSAAPADDPTQVGLDNYRDYFALRQKAIEDARAVAPSDVNVYQLCEVVRTKPSIERNAPSLARDVLPQVTCDLVGYSSYETALKSSTEDYDRSIAYIRSKARPSPTFGKNQVVISEIGLPENRKGFTNAEKDGVVNLMKLELERGMPYVLFWTMYDNGCDLPECNVYGGINANVGEANLDGYYVRRPDKSFSYIFAGLMQLFENDRYYNSDQRAIAITQCYKTHLGRTPDLVGFNFWYQQTIVTTEAVCKNLEISREAGIRQCYLKELGREPDAVGLKFWNSQSGVSVDQVCAELAKSPEGYIRQCYLKNIGREPDYVGLRYWLDIYQKNLASLESICSSIKE